LSFHKDLAVHDHRGDELVARSELNRPLGGLVAAVELGEHTRIVGVKYGGVSSSRSSACARRQTSQPRPCGCIVWGRSNDRKGPLISIWDRSEVARNNPTLTRFASEEKYSGPSPAPSRHTNFGTPPTQTSYAVGGQGAVFEAPGLVDPLDEPGLEGLEASGLDEPGADEPRVDEPGLGDVPPAVPVPHGPPL